MPPGRAAWVRHLLEVSDPMVSARRRRLVAAADSALSSRSLGADGAKCLTYQASARYVSGVAATSFTFQDC
jgi:hypothetical protein